MTRHRLLQLGAIAAVAAAALAGWPGRFDVYTIAIVAFALVNIAVPIAHAGWIRAAGVAASIFQLLQPGGLASVVMFLTLMLWTPAVLIASSLGSREAAGDDLEGGDAGHAARVSVVALILAVAIATLAYQLILGHGLQQTAALFIGLPALLAIVVVLGVSPRSGTGVACKAVTVGLLVSTIFLGEGVLCVVMSAPLFYLAAIVIGVAADRLRDRRAGPARTTLSCVGVLVFVPLSLEGVLPIASFERVAEVTRTRIVRAPPEAVARAVLETPRFDRALPHYLRAGFPRPVASTIDGSSVGATWVVRMRGGEMRLDGMEPRAGDLVLRLEEMGPSLVRWRAVSDDSHMTHFLSWRETVVSWEAVGDGTTRVTCTIRYRRDLDPSWYFGPWERYAVGLAASYLIDTVATP